MDLRFGTHHDPGHEPTALGVVEPAANDYVGLMVNPLLPRSLQVGIDETPAGVVAHAVPTTGVVVQEAG
jgi:hypothetical protein